MDQDVESAKMYDNHKGDVGHNLPTPKHMRVEIKVGMVTMEMLEYNQCFSAFEREKKILKEASEHVLKTV